MNPESQVSVYIGNPYNRFLPEIVVSVDTVPKNIELYKTNQNFITGLIFKIRSIFLSQR